MSPARALPIQIPAIVVGTMPYREADTIVRLLTPDHGRVSALARNARRSSRRFGGAIDLGNRIETTIRPSSRGLWNLDAAELTDGRLNIHTELGRLGLLAYACEIAGRLAKEGHEEPKLFGLLDMACTLLDAATHTPATGFRLGLETKALTFAGLAPVLDRCTACGHPPEPPMVLVPHLGGVQHADCATARGVTVSAVWMQAVERFRRQPLRDNLDTLPPTGPTWAMAEAIEAHLGQPLKSRRVLSSLLTEQPPG